MAVVDASVWVSLCHRKDRHHERSRDWLVSVLESDEALCAPALFVVEVAAAIRRLTGSEDHAREVLENLSELGIVTLIEVTVERSARAAGIAARTAVRGADAVYLELAASRDETLVTWDRRQLERGKAVASVMTPVAPAAGRTGNR